MAQDITLDFSSDYSPLLNSLKEVNKELETLRSTARKGQEETTRLIQGNVNQSKNLEKTLEAAGKAASKANQLIGNSDGFVKAEKDASNFNKTVQQSTGEVKKLGDEIKDISGGVKPPNVVPPDIDELINKYTEILSKNLEWDQAQKDLIREGIKIQVIYDQLADVVEKFPEQFADSKIEAGNLTSLLDELLTQAEQFARQPGSTWVEEDIEQVRQLSAEIQNAAEITRQIDPLNEAEVEKAISALKKLNDTAKKTDIKLDTRAQAATIALEQTKQKLLEVILAAEGVSTAVKAALATQVEQINTMDELVEFAEEFQQQIEGGSTKVVSLQTEIRNAREEAVQAVREFGEFSPEAIAATKKVSELKAEFRKLNQAAEALDPQQKFKAIIQLGQSIAGGFTAIQGALALVNTESEEVAQSLAKIQAALALTQGLNAFISGISDGFNNLLKVLGLTTQATTALTTAQQGQAAAAGATTAATTASGVAATGAAAGFRALTAAMVANPILAIVAALAAVTLALIAFTDDTEEAKEALDEFIGSIDELEARGTSQLKINQALAKTRAELNLIQAGDDPEARAKAIRENTAAQLALLEQERQQKLLIISQLQDAESKARQDEDEESEKALQARIEREVEALDNIKLQKLQVRGEEVVTLARIDKDIEKQEQESYQERLKQLDQFKKEYEALVLSLKKQSDAAVLDVADEESALKAQRNLAIAEVEEIEKALTEKGKLLDEDFELTAQQKQQLANLLTAIEKRYQEGILDLQRRAQEARLQLIVNGAERELAALELTQKERREKLLELGLSEDEIDTIFTKERNDLIQKNGLAQLQTELQIQENIIKARERGADGEIETEEEKNLAILDSRITFYEKMLSLIKEDGTQETKLLKTQLDAQLAAFRQAKNDLISEQDAEFNIFDLLGIKLDPEEEAEAKEALKRLGAALGQFKDTLFSSQQAEINLLQQRNDAYILSLEERISATKAQLDRELDLQREGLANNVDAQQEALATLEKQKVAALERDRQLAAQRAELARTEAVVDSAIQASSMATAVAQLFKSESKWGLPGIIAAGAAAIGLVSLFLSLKQRFSAASAPVEFGEGGELPDGLVKGKSHRQGGARIEGTNLFVEGGEMITNKKSTKKFKPILEAINDDNFRNLSPKVKEDFLERMLEGTGVTVSEESTEKAVQTKVTYQNHQNAIMNMQTKQMEKQLAELNGQVKGLRADLDQERITVMSDGTKIIQHKNYTKIIRPK